jgi:hypothetical protein
MKELPVKKLVCVRAGMGVGKTIAIRNMLSKECTKHKGTLCDVQPLSLQNCTTTLKSLQAVSRTRMANALRKTRGVYPEALGSRTIRTTRRSKFLEEVCPDSLHRVTTSTLHHLDEAVSIFLHFNSKLMKNSSVNLETRTFHSSMSELHTS